MLNYHSTIVRNPIARNVAMFFRSIGVILPTVEIARRAQQVAAELGMQEKIAIRVGNHMEGLESARQLESQGAEVLISRRSTAELIQEHLNTPNIPIVLTLEDIAQMLADARSITGSERPRIALFAMASDQTDIESFARHLNLNLRVYTITPNEEYLSLMVDRAIADKMDIIAAGTVVTAFANQRNFPSLLLDCGVVALRTAFLEADKVAYARKLEKARAASFRIVVETSRRGLFVLDGALRVQMANPASWTILGCQPLAVPAPLEDIFPEMLSLREQLHATEPSRNMFLNARRGPVVVDISPVQSPGALGGAVVTFEPAEAVSEFSSITRKKLFAQQFASAYTFASIVGKSPQILETIHAARDLADNNETVLIAGETGTGKELFAHAIHAASSRRSGPFVAVNCAALPSTLLESELFGYDEGSFTGANRKGKPGLFEMAQEGTIFLDEISEINKQVQLRLLRVLQERQIMRLGGTKLISLDIRVISATNKNINELKQFGRFREDLYYRLSALPLFIPPLRERNGDVAVLADYYLRAALSRGGPPFKMSRGVLRLLERHPWPGNVRELQNIIARLIVASKHGGINEELVHRLLAPEDFWNGLPSRASASSVPAHSDMSPDKRQEREHIINALQQCKGHRGRASAMLSMNRSTLFRKMAAYGIVNVSM